MVVYRFVRRILPGLIAWAAAAALAPSSVRAEQAILTVPGQNLSFLSQYVAIDERLWEKQGLDVKVLYIAGIGSMNAVIAGSADFSMGSSATITRAYARGQKIAALLTTYDKTSISIVIRKDVAEAAHFDPNVSLAERGRILKGKIIALSGIGNIPDVVLKVVAKDAGLAPNDVVEAPMQPPEFMAAFANKSIDGFSGSSPFVEQVQLDGTGVLVSDTRKGEPTEYSPVAGGLLLTRGDFCAAHRSACEKMTHGLVEALRIIRTDPRTSLAVMKAHFGAYDDKVLQAAYETQKAMAPENPIVTTAALENGDTMNVAAGFMKPEDKLADYAPLIDNSFVK